MTSLRWIFGGLLILALAVVVAPAQASTTGVGYDITATLTADNDFILYTADQAGNLTWRGTGTDRSKAYSFDNLTTDQYLYVLVWNDLNSVKKGDNNYQAWLGQFAVSGYQTLYSNTTQWKYIYSDSGNPSVTGSEPAVGTVQDLINSGNDKDIWETPAASSPNGSDNHWVWVTKKNDKGVDFGDNIGAISGISKNADWIWSDTFDQSSVSENGYVIFRADLSDLKPTPLPASVLLLGSGLMGLGLMGYRSKKS